MLDILIQNAKPPFDPLKETIIDYVLRKAAVYKRKRDLADASGVPEWNISKIVNQVNSPTLKTVQPLFQYFIDQDAKAKRRRKDKPSGQSVAIN
jgi:hypothetical protein